MRVIIESPFFAKKNKTVEQNVEYARKCMLDSLQRGESPFLSHLLYTQVLDDNVDAERRLGINAAFKWYSAAELVCIYLDRGSSKGMKEGIQVAKKIGIPIERRWLSSKIDRLKL